MDCLLSAPALPEKRVILDWVLLHFRDSLGSKIQKRRISAGLESFLDSPPTEAVIYFTDGSASPNPGPCGAGFFRQGGLLEERSSATFLGPGTNNIGELYGLGMALRCIQASPPVQYSVILTDSDYVHGLLVRNSRVGQNRELVLALKDLLEAVRAIHTVHILWIKAHAGYHGNEMADLRAKDGAEENTRNRDLGQLDFVF